jgi:hypothetical protein
MFYVLQVTVVFYNLCYERSISILSRNGTVSYNEIIVDWWKADMQCLMNYQFMLDSLLCKIDIPEGLLKFSGHCPDVSQMTGNYYNFRRNCVREACLACVPCRALKDLKG